MDNAKLTALPKALAQPFYEPVAETYRVLGKVVEKYAGLLETCDCHRALWENRTSRKRRRSRMMADIQRSSCCLMGRRLPWWISIGFRKFVEELRSSISTRLQEFIVALAPRERGILIDAAIQLRTAMIEHYTEKFDYVFHAPYSGIAVFHCTQGGSVSRAKELLQSCLDEVDVAVAAGKAKRLHRVARKLFMKGTSVRAAADQFLADPAATMEAYPVLYVALQEYALVAFGEEDRKRTCPHQEGWGTCFRCEHGTTLCHDTRAAERGIVEDKQRIPYSLCSLVAISQLGGPSVEVAVHPGRVGR